MNFRYATVVTALGLGLSLPIGPAAAKQRIQQALTPAAGTGASGQARLLLRSDTDGRFEVRARNLAINSTFEVLIDGVNVGSLTTTGGGNGQARFRTRPHGHDALLGFDPRGATVVVRDASGTDVLQGTVPTGSATGSPDKITCCIPDDHGTECEDRTADECGAKGGTVSAATSCLPNPCADAIAVTGQVVCCVPDDAGPECETRSATECSARGGITVNAATCDPNPCAATPAAPKTRCCLPDNSGIECEDRTADQCTTQGGVDMGPGSCTANPCATTTLPPTTTPDDSTGTGGAHGSGGQHSGEVTGGTPSGCYYCGTTP